MSQPRVIGIACIRKFDQAIGHDNGLLFSIKKDLKFFKDQTMGGAVIMGRKNWESIPLAFRPLTGRLNIVLSRQNHLQLPDGVFRAETLEAAIGLAKSSKHTKIFIIGGGQIYQQALQERRLDEVILTVVDFPAGKATSFFAYDKKWRGDFAEPEVLDTWEDVRSDDQKTDYGTVRILRYMRRLT